MARAGKKKWVWVGAAMLGCMIVLIAIVLRAPAKPGAEIVFLEADKMLKEPNRLQRWVGALRSKLVKPAAVMISAEIVSSDRLTSLEKAPELIGRKPLAETEGVKVWIVSDTELYRLSDAFWFKRTNLIANPRMKMNEGQVGSAFIGPKKYPSTVPLGAAAFDVGLTLRMKAFRQETNADMYLGVTEIEAVLAKNEIVSTAVRTNIHVSARVQVPRQHRVLFVCDRKDGRGPVCVFVQATWLP